MDVPYIGTGKNSWPLRIEDVDFEIMQANAVEFKGYSINHQHYSHELHYVHEGSVKLTVDEKCYTLEKGDMLYVPSNIYHDALSDFSVLICFEFNGSKNDIRPLRSIYKLINSLPDDRPLKFHVGNAVEASAEELLRTGGDIKLKLVTFVFCCLMFLCGCLESNAVMRVNFRLSTGQMNSENLKLIDRTDDYLHRFTEHPTLNGLSDELGLTRRRTEYLLKKSYGTTFTRKLTEIRMINASSLLRKGEYSFKKIAELTGYRSEQGFYSAFYKYYKVSPGDYAKNWKNIKGSKK